MILTVFRSRLNDRDSVEYQRTAARMTELARSMPGYIAHKTFTAEDGERVTLVEFADAESQHAWARHPEHVAAQQRGRADFYAEYRLQVCHVDREVRFPR